VDPRAKRILFGTYWKSGWLPENQWRVSPQDLAYAKSKGLMFDPLTVTHDECVTRIGMAVAAIGDGLAGRAFVASLSTRRLDWRSGLGSYAMGSGLPAHPYTAAGHTCGVCEDAGMEGDKRYVDEDVNVFNFERLKWGGVRHTEIAYVLFDLEQLRDVPIPEPTEEDRTILRTLVEALDGCPTRAGYGLLEKAIAPLLPSAKDERRQLLEILIAARVLDSPEDHRDDAAPRCDPAALARWFGPYR
jgi:hypothetical protein